MKIVHFDAAWDPEYSPPSHRGFPDNLPQPALDGLPVLDIGEHSMVKLKAVGRFANAFSTALKNTDATAYLDLFAGPGLLRSRDNDQPLWGTPLIALQCPERFRKLVFVEMNPASAQALLKRAGQAARRGECVTVITALAEDAIPEVIAQLPPKSIVLTLVDPFRVEFSLNALRALTTARRVDLILLFADGMDLKRNLDLAMANDKAHAPRFDAAFGGADWRKVVVPHDPPGRSAARLRQLYVDRLKQLGFTHFGKDLPVKNSRGAELYVLLYASHVPLGAKLWDDCTRSSQTEFDFG